MSGPSWDLPQPDRGVSGLPESEHEGAQATFFGEDIWFDVASAPENGEADYVETAAGDLQVATGRDALEQSLRRRVITRPSEWPTLPGFGLGAQDYIKAKNTAATRAELESKVRAQFLRDPRVLRVDVVTIAQLEDGSDGVRLTVKVTPRGRLRSDRPLQFQMEVR